MSRQLRTPSSMKGILLHESSSCGLTQSSRITNSQRGLSITPTRAPKPMQPSKVPQVVVAPQVRQPAIGVVQVRGARHSDRQAPLMQLALRAAQNPPPASLGGAHCSDTAQVSRSATTRRRATTCRSATARRSATASVGLRSGLTRRQHHHQDHCPNRKLRHLTISWHGRRSHSHPPNLGQRSRRRSDVSARCPPYDR